MSWIVVNGADDDDDGLLWSILDVAVVVVVVVVIYSLVRHCPPPEKNLYHPKNLCPPWLNGRFAKIYAPLNRLTECFATISTPGYAFFFPFEWLPSQRPGPATELDSFNKTAEETRQQLMARRQSLRFTPEEEATWAAIIKSDKARAERLEKKQKLELQVKNAVAMRRLLQADSVGEVGVDLLGQSTNFSTNFLGASTMFAAISPAVSSAHVWGSGFWSGFCFRGGRLP